MMRRISICIVYVAVLAGSVNAMTSEGDSAREPQIRAYRQRVRDNYEKRLVERQNDAVRAYEDTRASIFTPPWMRGTAHTGLLSGTEIADVLAAEQAEKRNHRLLVSIMLLVLIGAAAGWARHATREIDE